MMTPRGAASRVPGMAPNAPKRNLIVLLLYLLCLAIGGSVIGLENAELPV